MAKVTVNFNSRVWVPVRPCHEVAVCLKDDSIAVPTSGILIAFATVQNSGRLLGPRRLPINPIDPRDSEYYEYALEFETTDFEEGVVPTCDDIEEINPYACTIHKLLDAIEA